MMHKITAGNEANKNNEIQAERTIDSRAGQRKIEDKTFDNQEIEAEEHLDKDKTFEEDNENLNDPTLESSRAPRDENEEENEKALDEILSNVQSEMVSHIQSEAPTEQLAAEYKKLLEEYDTL